MPRLSLELVHQLGTFSHGVVAGRESYVRPFHCLRCHRLEVPRPLLHQPILEDLAAPSALSQLVPPRQDLPHLPAWHPGSPPLQTEVRSSASAAFQRHHVFFMGMRGVVAGREQRRQAAMVVAGWEEVAKGVETEVIGDCSRRCRVALFRSPQGGEVAAEVERQQWWHDWGAMLAVVRWLGSWMGVRDWRVAAMQRGGEVVG
ncbi:hypothetical protein C4D60_Mb04t00220 [Musa balbisiana]|uniref:Uncharacterized protein n=1 Tax=Musa balbisiana TaxID=52838 RepID=A0A4V4H9E6_MUSBA|nr:hypothetical protein C4D60_Mb04t00220 [Musa balbisiana]